MRFPWSKKTAARQTSEAPGINWFWTLTLDGTPTTNFDWADILRGLENLRMDPDSFLILERRNPEQEEDSGFLQCALILAGDHTGWYTLECGYPGPEGPVLLAKEVPSVLEAVPVFEAVYRRRGTVFSGFSDLSDAMGQTEHMR